MAAGNEPGIVGLWVGRNWETKRNLAMLDSAVADNAVASNPYYINGVEKPDDDGQILSIGAGPHIRPGQFLYVSLDPTAADIIDTDDELAVLSIQYQEYDTATGQSMRRIWNAVGQRNTTVVDGGLTDDPAVTPGFHTPVYAFGPCPPGAVRTLFGPMTIDIRDDTA